MLLIHYLYVLNELVWYRQFLKGYRPGDFESITVTVDADKPSSPCGACRQVLKELCDDDMPVYMTNHKGDMVMMTVAELLPFGFSGKDLE